ncbi:MAG: hypothetical protein LBF24_01370 [Puniceicoccales bacterium]|jgi:hypothetical protein|nr:hypothetical protein [Puniceicoccales bacterium]
MHWIALLAENNGSVPPLQLLYLSPGSVPGKDDDGRFFSSTQGVAELLKFETLTKSYDFSQPTFAPIYDGTILIDEQIWAYGERKIVWTLRAILYVTH